MIEPISLFVMMKKKFGARAVGGLKARHGCYNRGGLNEMRFGPSNCYILTSNIYRESIAKPPYATRVSLMFRDTDNEDSRGRAVMHVIGTIDLDFTSKIEDLRAWIVSLMLEFEMSR